MSKIAFTLRLPQSLKDAAQRLARQDGVSLNQWIAVAVAQKIGAVETAAEFLKQRAGDATRSNMLDVLKQVRNAPPLPGDEILP